MNLLTIETFAAAANQQFDLAVGGAAMPVTLIEIKPTPLAPGGPRLRQGFSLLFKSVSPVILPQMTYRLRNATVGVVDIFLVPVARDGSAVVYQAVFS